MSGEEFQKLVLEELKGLKTGMAKLEEGFERIEGRQTKLEEGFERLETRQTKLEENQIRFEKKLDTVYEQTAGLIEFRTEVNMKIDSILEDNRSIHEMLGEHEVAIRTLKRRPV